MKLYRVNNGRKDLALNGKAILSNVQASSFEVVDQIIALKFGSHYTFYTLQGKKITIPDNLKVSAYRIYDNFIAYKNTTRNYGVIDSSSNVILDHKYSKVEFIDGVIAAKHNKYVKIFDLSGNLILNTDYHTFKNLNGRLSLSKLEEEKHFFSAFNTSTLKLEHEIISEKVSISWESCFWLKNGFGYLKNTNSDLNHIFTFDNQCKIISKIDLHYGERFEQLIQLNNGQYEICTDNYFISPSTTHSYLFDNMLAPI